MSENGDSERGLTNGLAYLANTTTMMLISEQTIETVEEEVERLLEADALADQVQYGK